MTADPYIGLAFPVVRVRYAGPTNSRGSRYVATIEQSRDRRTRTTHPYDDGRSASENAHAAARACWEKHRAQLADNFRRDGIAWTDDDDAQTRASVLIPGDLNHDSYAFIVLPPHVLSSLQGRSDG